MRILTLLLFILWLFFPAAVQAQPVSPPPEVNPMVQKMVDAVRADSIRANVETMVGFKTRHAPSDTTSNEEGIGPTRRWLEAKSERISEQCGGCLEVRFRRLL